MPRRNIDRICTEVNARMTVESAVSGLAHGIELLGTMLPEYFPRTDDDVNELSNAISIGGM